MKTEYENKRDDLTKKAAKLKSFSEILDEHLVNQQQVSDLIWAMTEFSDFMTEFNALGEYDVVSRIRRIEDILRQSGNKDAIEHFREMSELILRATIMAGRHSKAESTIYQMENELHELAGEF